MYPTKWQVDVQRQEATLPPTTTTTTTRRRRAGENLYVTTRVNSNGFFYSAIQLVQPTRRNLHSPHLDQSHSNPANSHKSHHQQQFNRNSELNHHCSEQPRPKWNRRRVSRRRTSSRAFNPNEHRHRTISAHEGRRRRIGNVHGQYQSRSRKV